MRHSSIIEAEIEDFNIKLEKIEIMTDAEVCVAWNVDERSEIVDCINDVLKTLEEELAEVLDYEDWDENWERNWRLLKWEEAV